MSITALILCLAGGYLLRKIVRRDKFFDLLGVLTNDVLLSFFVFGSVASKELSFLISVRVVLLAVVLVLLVNLGGSYVYKRLALKDDRPWATALLVLAIFPNSAALGYPLVSLFVSDLAPAVIFSQVNFMLVLPLAIFILNRQQNEGSSLKSGLVKTLSTPSVGANLLALLAVVTRFTVPGQLLSVFVFVGKWSLPLMLIYFGSRLSFQHFAWRRLLEVGVLRMLLPALLIVLALSGLERSIFYSILIETSMPPAIIAGALLARYRVKAEEAVSVSFVLTALTLAVFILLKLVV